MRIAAIQPVYKAFVPRLSPVPGRAMPAFAARRAPLAPARVASDAEADTDAMISGEWPVNWSLASYEDLGTFFKNQFFKQDMNKTLGDVMSTKLVYASKDMSLTDAEELMAKSGVSGLPVVDDDGTLVGVLSRRDLAKGGSTVAGAMTAKPIAAQASAKVSAAAVLMLKNKVHRIPIVDGRARCVGIVTRTDIFTALAMENM